MNGNQRSIPDSIWDRIRSLILAKDYGSVEIYIEGGEVTQVTDRTICKIRREVQPIRRHISFPSRALSLLLAASLLTDLVSEFIV